MSPFSRVVHFARKKPGGRSLIDHLEEFRKRIVRSCYAIAAGVLLTFTYIDPIVKFVLKPMRAALPPGSKLIYTQPGEAFSLYMQIAFLAGALLASPFILYQFWMLIAPVLYAKQKRFVVPFVVLTTVGALAGAAFSHWIVFPYMIAFFGTFASPNLTFLPKVEDSFDLYVKMFGAMVLIFQIPTVVYFFARMGLVTAGFLWKNTRYAILGTFIISAVLTPSGDPWNQTVFAAPMIALYLLSIVIAWAVAPVAKLTGGTELAERSDEADQN